MMLLDFNNKVYPVTPCQYQNETETVTDNMLNILHPAAAAVRTADMWGGHRLGKCTAVLLLLWRVY